MFVYTTLGLAMLAHSHYMGALAIPLLILNNEGDDNVEMKDTKMSKPIRLRTRSRVFYI